MESKIKAMESWKTIIALVVACFAGGLGETTAQGTPEPETLEIQHTDSSGTVYSTPVAKDVESLSFTNQPITSLTLPEDLLSRLEKLVLGGVNLTNLTLPEGLSNLMSILLYDLLEAYKQWYYPKELLVPHGMNTDNLKIGVAAVGERTQWISIEERESTSFPFSYPFSIKYYKRSSSPAEFL